MNNLESVTNLDAPALKERGYTRDGRRLRTAWVYAQRDEAAAKRGPATEPSAEQVAILSELEERLAQALERGRRAHVEAGEVLLEIRDGKRYEGTKFATFDEYCRAKWRMSRAHAYRLIGAAEVARILSPFGDTVTTESHARELLPLASRDPAAAARVYRELKERHGDRVTASLIRDAIDSSRPARKKAPHPKPTQRLPRPDEWILSEADALHRALAYVKAARLCLSRGADAPGIRAHLATVERLLDIRITTGVEDGAITVTDAVHAVDMGGGKHQAAMSVGLSPTLATTHGGAPVVAYPAERP